MTTRLVPAAASAVGLFLLVAATAAVVEHAPQPGIVFGALGLAHLAIGVAVARGSRLAAGVGAVIGAVTGTLVIVGLAFIVGIEAGIGFDLTVAWFAPLNGYATIAVSTSLLVASFILVSGGIAAVRKATAATAAPAA